jgi:hypothetical protein
MQVGTIYGGGRMAVFPGRVRLTPSTITRRLSGGTTVLHTAHEVEMIRPRIALPWLNTGFVFHDDEQIVVVGTAFVARRQVCTALRAAGFEVDERRTWLSLQADRSRVAARRSNL